MEIEEGTMQFTCGAIANDLSVPSVGTGVELATGNEKGNMSRLVTDILSGRYSTGDLLNIFQVYPVDELTALQAAECVNGVLATATYTIDASEYAMPLIVPAGTGGDGKGTVNITTIAGFVIAASGEAIVPLYGNRKASGKFGKMDVLEALGIPIDLPEAQVHSLLKTVGIAPVFARNVYPGARYIAQARAQYGKPTLFNLVMPQAAPVSPDAALLLGCANEVQLESMAQIAHARGIQRAILVHNCDHQLDELATGRNRIVILDNGKITSIKLRVGESEDIKLLQAETPDDFRRLFEWVLDPSYNSPQLNAIRKVVALNAACGLFLAHRTTEEFSTSFFQCYEQSLALLRDGKAKQKLDQLRRARV